MQETYSVPDWVVFPGPSASMLPLHVLKVYPLDHVESGRLMSVPCAANKVLDPKI